VDLLEHLFVEQTVAFFGRLGQSVFDLARFRWTWYFAVVKRADEAM
jgi:hypothetical protein